MQGVQNGMQPLCQFTPAAPICCRHRPALVGKNVGQDRVRVPCRVDQFDQGAGTGGDLRGGSLVSVFLTDAKIVQPPQAAETQEAAG